MNIQNKQEQQRDYPLNLNKAMKKKVSTCDANYKVKVTKRSGIQIFEFSAALYELYHEALI